MIRSPMPARTTPMPRSQRPLRGGAPMLRGEGLHPTGQLPQRRAEPRRRDRGEEDGWLTVVKPLAWDRCGGIGECCGDRLDRDNFDAHHRRLRTRGGADHITNCVAVHPWCHTINPWSIHQNPTWAEERGLMVASWEDPETVPLWLPYKRRVLLSDDGTYVDIPVLP